MRPLISARCGQAACRRAFYQQMSVLYLDCDMVILHSIRELYGYKAWQNVVAAIEEPTVFERVRHEIGLDYEAS